MTDKLKLYAELAITEKGQQRLILAHKAFIGHWVGTIVDNDLTLTKSRSNEGARANSAGVGVNPRRYIDLHRATHEIPRATPGKPVCTPVEAKVRSDGECIVVLGALRALHTLRKERQEPTASSFDEDFRRIEAKTAALNAEARSDRQFFIKPDGTVGVRQRNVVES